MKKLYLVTAIVALFTFIINVVIMIDEIVALGFAGADYVGVLLTFSIALTSFWMYKSQG